ncbi:MAG: thiamine pyrophosphate-dependent dehydrogenase E1 component subunit alpha [Actinobacteria bacterium]|nr:thiamine pyrophosphate-dependent dehydrogenase E1 component subunit alpha [Actinomycetota bacterium]
MSSTPVPALEERELYRQMALIRCFEEAAYRAYEAGEIKGTVHASIGQEAIAVGVISALERTDLVFTHHRGHGHALAKGVEPSRLFAELLGRGDGVSGGKGGSMHATDTGCGFLGSLAVVGGSIPLAVGVALAAHRRETDAVAVAFFGDGAVNQGVLYESMNLAVAWRLPVVFVCENNGYAISVPNSYATAGEGVIGRARSFGVEAEQVDGQDVLAVREIARRLVRGARDGRPALIEALTYRLVGHSRGDPPHGLYRSKEEVEQWRKRDPLTVLAAAGGLGEGEGAEILAVARRQMDEAIEVGRESPAPAPERTTSEVWGP